MKYEIIRLTDEVFYKKNPAIVKLWTAKQKQGGNMINY